MVAAFVPPGADSDCDEVFVVSGHPLGLGLTGLPAHQRDYTSSVLGQADRFTARATTPPTRALRSGSDVLTGRGAARRDDRAVRESCPASGC